MNSSPKPEELRQRAQQVEDKIRSSQSLEREEILLLFAHYLSEKATRQEQRYSLE